MSDQSTEILAALKKVADWADFQKKITKWSLLAIIPFILLGIGASLYFEKKIEGISEGDTKKPDWYDVSNASRKGDLKKALTIADELLLRNPQDFEGYYKKGEILLMLDDRAGALESFTRAEAIFPIPKYKLAVEALKTK
jgi:tetratricopeptide (TPR) repeat protein